MTQQERRKLVQKLETRVIAGIYFVELDYLPRHSTPDAAWIRNIYILLSFYTELLLKAILVMSRDFEDVQEVDAVFRRVGHNLRSIADEIGAANLASVGISSVTESNHEYKIETARGCFFVKDFTDIRYDFLDDKVRTLQGDEHKKFKEQIELMHEICLPVKQFAWDPSSDTGAGW